MQYKRTLQRIERRVIGALIYQVSKCIEFILVLCLVPFDVNAQCPPIPQQNNMKLPFGLLEKLLTLFYIPCGDFKGGRVIGTSPH